jgi:NNP family nitrate/nitrite transporter-like MFS transporter
MATTQTTTTTHTPRRLGRRWIDDWRPEDLDFWNARGRTIAGRNLLFSVFSEHIGFSVWSLWSVIVLFLGPEYGIDAAGKFLLTALPTLVGALLRVPYTFAVAVFGGRNWTIVSALMLLIPTVLIGIVLEPGVSYSTLLLVAMTAGVGGGNFASSMTNINHFYPSRLKGWALGRECRRRQPRRALSCSWSVCWSSRRSAPSTPRALVVIYIPLIILSALGAALMMNNLTPGQQRERAPSAR